LKNCVSMNRCLDESKRVYEIIRVPGHLVYKSLLLWMFFAIGLIAAGGCSQNGENQNDYLIQVGSGSVTVAEFNRAVANASEESFPGEQNLEQSALKDLKVRVLNQMTEELIIAQRAQQLGLHVSSEELEEAVNAIKADYPDNTFEETLLENAVSLEEWKKKLAMRLIVQKVITRELIDKVQISTQDVADYYQKHYPDGLPEQEAAADINERIIMHLRQQKAEQSYQEWISKLRQSFPVNISQKHWEK
jgi:hypothetical protein